MRLPLFALLVGVLLLESCENAQSVQANQYYTNPVVSSGADPWIIKHDGLYFFCSSYNAPGIGISVSKNLHQINPRTIVWKTPALGAWNAKNIWAPELHFWNGKWYIYYAAGKVAGTPFIYQRSGVLESVTSSPFGDYVDKGMLFTGDDYGNWDANIWAIDLTTFEHKGVLYAVWSGWEKNESDDATKQHLYIARMENPWTIATARVKISSPELDYEQGVLPLNEGPEILKHNNDVFIIYSCGQSWLATYKLAYLRLKDSDADPMKRESWIKGSKPLFEGTETVYGVGHASFTTSPDDKEYYILYHSKKNTVPGWDRDIRLQKFTFDEKTGLPVFGNPAPLTEKLPVPSGTTF